jgi:small subunit ribosomal protein S8
MITDPIADYLTRLRNAIHARHKSVQIPASKLKKEITRLLFDNGYIKQYKFDDTVNHQGVITIDIKYDSRTKHSPITTLTRISKPGHRRYVGADDLPNVLNGLGIAILSTSKGVMSDKEAKKEHTGGEVLCYVY